MKNLYFIIVFCIYCSALITLADSSDIMPLNLQYLEVIDEMAELVSNRPESSNNTTDVNFYVFVIDIDKIDGAAQNFSVNVFILMSWKDERLAHEEGNLTMPLSEIWTPDIMITNQGGVVRKSLPEEVQIDCEGNVTYRQRYTGSLSQPLKLSEFPFDEHRFEIQFVSPGSRPEDINFIPLMLPEKPEAVGGVLYHDLSLPDWEIVDYEIHAIPYKPIANLEVAGFAFKFTAKRLPLYYIWQVIVPLLLIVMMSWGAFYIDPTNAGAQIGVGTSSMLTLIAYRFMLGQMIPRLPYMTRLDYFTLGSTILVFLTLAEVILTTNLALRGRGNLALKIDLWSRFIFPTVFMLWSFWSLAI